MRRPKWRHRRSAPTTRSSAPAAIRRDFKGDGTQPRLAGQNREYLQKTMTDFRTGARGNNPGMTDFMKAVAEADITALAAWLAGM